ncbi:MAG: response regulator [bacterium]|nr:response regulator [bacterium]
MNLSITQKLAIGFLTIAFSTAAVGTLAYVSLLRIGSELQVVVAAPLNTASARDREIVQRVRRLIRQSAQDKIILFAGMILSFIIAWWGWLFLSRQVADPIISLTQKADLISQQSGKLHETVATSGQDETKKLARVFNQMSASLQEQQMEIERINRELERRDQLLGEANAKLERLNAMKSDFLSILSHELRTPLTVIKGYLSLMKNQRLGPINEQQLKGLTIADERADHLNSLISDLLDLSRIELNKYEIRQEVWDLAKMAEAAVDSMRPLFEKKGLRFKTHIPAELPLVYADKQKVSQVLTNLLSNAIKFTPAGGEVILEALPSVEERSGEESRPEGDDFVQINVKDTGIGLAEEEIQKIFDKFYQVDDSVTREHSGSGLGLCIARNIVELHHGRMWVKSRKGEGSTFSFTLPKADSSLMTEAKAAPSAKEGKPLFSLSAADKKVSSDSRKRQESGGEDMAERSILLVDNNPLIQQLIITCLSALPCKIITASDGIEALERVFQTPVDLIVLDINLPRLSGYDLCQIIKTNEKTKHIPVVILSASAQRSEIERGFQMGANDYITHPFVPEEVVKRIHNLMISKTA